MNPVGLRCRPKPRRGAPKLHSHAARGNEKSSRLGTEPWRRPPPDATASWSLPGRVPNGDVGNQRAASASTPAAPIFHSFPSSAWECRLASSACRRPGKHREAELPRLGFPSGAWEPEQTLAQPARYRPWPGFRHPCRNDGISLLGWNLYITASAPHGNPVGLRCGPKPRRDAPRLHSHAARGNEKSVCSPAFRRKSPKRPAKAGTTNGAGD